jgi:hypothetical protein
MNPLQRPPILEPSILKHFRPRYLLHREGEGAARQGTDATDCCGWM